MFPEIGDVPLLIDKFALFVAWGLGVGLVLYSLFIVLLILAPKQWDTVVRVREMIFLNSYSVIGLPLAAISSFALVFVFNLRFGKAPPGDTGVVEQTILEFFGLRFTGPSGPTTLWVLCYLSIVLSIRVVHGLRNNA